MNTRPTVLLCLVLAFGLAAANADTFYVTYNGNNTIEKFSSSGADLGTFASGLNGPQGLAFDSNGNLYVAEALANVVEKFSPTGTDLGAFVASGLDHPSGLAFDSSGNLYVTNSGSSSSLIKKFSSTGTYLSTFPSGGRSGSYGLAVDRNNNIYVPFFGSNSIVKYSSSGADLGAFASAGLSRPTCVAFDGSGNLYAADGLVVKKFTASGTDLGNFASVSLNPSSNTQGIAFDSSGNLYLANAIFNTIEKFSPTGVDMGSFGGGIPGAGQPLFIAVLDDFGRPLSLPPPTPFSIIGTVRDGAGFPLGGALVTLKRGSTVYWQGTTAANGTFQDPAASAPSYTVLVTKPGYGTSITNLTATTGGNQTLNITLNALPPPLATVTVNQTPPATAVGQCRTWSQTDADAPKLFLLGTNGQLTSSLTNLNSSRATVVITHGWIPTGSGAPTWPNQLATLIQQHHALGAAAPNILVWDWHKDAEADRPPIDRVTCDGIELGKALLQSLGAGYSQRVHFIGHSLGTFVNAYACDYAHGSFARPSNNPASHWNAPVTQPHITLLDEAEVASVFGSQVLTSADVAWKATQLKTKLLTGVETAATLAATWKSPIPKTKTPWIDNYISAVGFHRDEAVNVCLLTPTLTLNTQPGTNLIQQLADAHSYAHLWYRNSIGYIPTTPQPSFGSSYEAGGILPPSGAGMTAGNDWYEHLATADAFDLTRNPLDLNPVGLVVANADFPILLGLTVLPRVEAVAQASYNVTVLPADETGKYVLRNYEAGIQWAGDLGGTVIYKTGQVITETKEKVGIWWDAAQDAAANVLNSIDPSTQLVGPVAAPVFSIKLSTQAAPLVGLPKDLAGTPASLAGQPAYAWLTVNVPANAGMIAFDFTVTGDPVDDAIACAVNGQNIFTLPAKFAPDGSPVSTDMMDISTYAGQNVELFFGLVGGTSTNCQVAIDGIRFITIPLPKVGLVANGPNVDVKWPAAATGWILETSDTLAPNSWQPVPMTGVTVASGVATIAQPASGPRRFYRLRRGP